MIKRDDNKQWLTLAQQLDQARKQRKRMELKEKELLDDLIQLSQMKDSRGGDYTVRIIERKGIIDYRKVVAIELSPEVDLEIYRKKDSEYWKFSSL